ncbi:pyridoxal phosphate-dependent aminotransferase [Actinoallomurus rhizosphaericola]|uniref:pyridoxal phosphate-dependent aminotransferase n=1 Tax=Actinoallomurus rhizosphaericola TaxID=2952536 RepID=UPI002091F537|nr:pyridoxal phosphate-dependent aminotransferase [Actinoallomurus rhizosphaericola]MCO5998843.1 pyridoxal phosphate-dependent aminotransferase [Actinoallomurus rhizosphaericola]
MSQISYEIRGPLLRLAKDLERAGETVIKLNIGDPAAFGIEAPEEVVEAARAAVTRSTAYSDAQGLWAAREAVVADYAAKGLHGLRADDVFLGNGVSELVSMALHALLDPGDEVLIPAPDYPLWTASTALAGGRPVHYLCDERADWLPDLSDLKAKITDRTRAIVVINPNNPTGAVWPREVLEQIATLAGDSGLVLMADEIYDEIRYDDVPCVPAASLAPDLVCLTFGGLSKRYLVPGFRCGWMAISGPRGAAADYAAALETLATMRLCPNVVAQHVVPVALRGRQATKALTAPGGRLHEQRERCWKLLTELPGVSCVKPQGAFYVFPRLDPRVHRITDDERFAYELLEREKVLVVQGTGLGWPRHDHFRMVTLPPVAEIEEAVGRLAQFLDRRLAPAH